jgi:ABC-type branched-subunit amino acid transport system ATPase component
MSLLDVSGIRSGYGKVPVLHDVSVHVDERELVAVIGANGAGKSTLMKTITRLLPLMSGSISFDGHDLSGKDPRAAAKLDMAYVPQDGNTFPGLSVEDNLSVSLIGRRRGESAEMREQMYERFPVLRDRRRQAASTLSGGERQMLALASAMITSPRFLVLDEPTTGLAPSIVQSLIQQILRFRSEGTTVLWVVEENPLQVLEHVDRVYMMQAGVVERELAAEELLGDQTLQELFFGVHTDVPSNKETGR